MLIHRDLLIKIKFLSISIFSLILVKIFLKVMPLSSMIKKIKKVSRLLFSLNKQNISIERIHFWYLKLNKILNIKSCFVNSLVKKIIFSFFGHNLVVVCGIKLDDGSNVDGHAWLCYKNETVFEDNKNLNGYIESFRV
tara:strand:+ start:95 stop:508 length:414 start_codon:yes stop_codon:yes gene_type:complete